jgi:hypothetical protein
MYTENIVRDLLGLIHDVKSGYSNVRQSKTDAFRRGDLEDALWGLDQATDTLSGIEERLVKLVDDIKMEELSAKVQSK